MKGEGITLMQSLQTIEENFEPSASHAARRIHRSVTDELKSIADKGIIKRATIEEIRNISQSMTISILDSLGFKRNTE